MEKILEALKDYVRVNTNNNTVEIYDEFGVKVRLQPDAETLEEFKANFKSF